MRFGEMHLAVRLTDINHAQRADFEAAVANLSELGVETMSRTQVAAIFDKHGIPRRLEETVIFTVARRIWDEVRPQLEQKSIRDDL